VLRETQHGEVAEGTAQTAPATSTPGPSNRALGALAASSNPRALARAIAGQGLGNRATQALIAREEAGSTLELHQQVYGDSELAHGRGPTPPSDTPYEFSDDPLAADLTPDTPIRVKPGPVRATLIRPGPPRTQKGEWLENALRGDPLLKELPNWAREKAIDGLKDIDETVAEKIIDALPWESKAKEAATAALKALLQTAKGKKFETPVAPPNPRLPDWTKPQDFQAAPGQVIIQGPVIKW
jgi:hypothetical protein